jgi:hypothetical protein
MKLTRYVLIGIMSCLIASGAFGACGSIDTANRPGAGEQVPPVMGGASSLWDLDQDCTLVQPVGCIGGFCYQLTTQVCARRGNGGCANPGSSCGSYVTEDGEEIELTCQTEVTCEPFCTWACVCTEDQR